MPHRRWLRPVRIAVFLALAAAVAAAALAPEFALRRTVLLVAVSMFVGWSTNWIAIWFLFHRFLGLPGTGVVPRNRDVFVRALAARVRGLLDQSGIVDAVSARVDAYLDGPEWRSLLEARVEGLVDRIAQGIRGLPEVIERDEDLLRKARDLVYDTLLDFAREDRYLPGRQEVRRAVVARAEALLPAVRDEIRERMEREVDDLRQGMGTFRRIFVDVTGVSGKMRTAPDEVSAELERRIRAQLQDDDAMDETIARALERAAEALRENRDLDPVLAKGVEPGAEALAAGLERGEIRERVRFEILRRASSPEFRAAVTGTLAARVREFLDVDLETRTQAVLGKLSDREIEAQFREVADGYFLWIEIWGGALGAIGGLLASRILL